MSYSNYTHIGAYALVKAPPITVTDTRLACPTHGELRIASAFCPHCGQRIVEISSTEQRRSSLYTLLPDHDEPLFSPSGVDELGADEFVVIGNKSKAGEVPDDDVMEITSAVIAECMSEFAHTYSAELAHLEKVATSVLIKFGVIFYVL